jgi:thioredoxin 1
MLVNLEQTNFDDLVRSQGIALIDCWAPWCGACKDFTPVFEAASQRHPDHVFAKLNTHVNDELTKHLKVSHIPTIILFRDGLLLLRQPGHLTAAEIDEVISKAESIDMDQVRSDMEAREQSTTS